MVPTEDTSYTITMSTLKVIMKGQMMACQCLKLKNPAILQSLGTTGNSNGLGLSLSPLMSRGLATNKEIKENLKNFEAGNFEKIPDPGHLEHFNLSSLRHQLESKIVMPFSLFSAGHARTGREPAVTPDKDKPPIGTYVLPHPIWTDEQLSKVSVTHKEPEGRVDKAAYFTVKTFRTAFDVFSGFLFGQRNEKKWLNRICFLETVAGVPGMVAAMMRHMRSLRMLQRDYGWIHTLLEEAENERMHLLTAMQLKQPSLFFRLSVIGAQGVFVTMFGLSYIVSPRFCHRFVGYLEEEAVKTYTKCLQDIDAGPMEHWKTQPAPEVAVRYWKLESDATMRDVILAIRADEAHHRVVNHTLASMKPDDFNPYKPGK